MFPEETSESLLDQRKTELLYRNVGLAQAANIFNATLLAFANVEMGTAWRPALAWWLVFSMIACGRWALAKRFHAADKVGQSSTSWRSRYLVGSVAGALAWAAAIVLFMWKAPEGALLLTGLVLTGTVAGAISVLASVPSIFRVYTLTVGIPMIACVLLQAESTLYWSFGVMSIAFLGAVLKSGTYYHDTLDAAIRLELDQTRLASTLELARNQAVSALEDRAQAEKSLLESEARFRLLASATFEGIAITDSGRYVDANDQLLALLGYSRDELLQLSIRDTVPEAEYLRIGEKIEQDLESLIEYEMLTKDGRCIEVATHGQTVLIDGHPLRITAIRDIRERKAMISERDALIKTLESERDFLEILTASLPGTFYTISAQGRFLRWNRNFEEATGLTAAQISTLNPTDLFAERDRDLMQQQIAKVFIEGHNEIEAQVRVADGTYRPYLMTGRLATQNGESVLVGSGMDVTSVKSMERELREHRDNLEELVNQRTIALEQAKAAADGARSLVEATLEATNNGILVVGLDGQITLSNKRFTSMWRIPEQLIATGDDKAILEHVLAQLKNPEKFLSKVRQLYNKPDGISRDTLQFLDGRVFERFSHPQRIGGEIVGRVWSFLDISDQHQAQQRILQLSNAITDELAKSERQRGQLEALLSAIPDLVWMKDSQGIFLSANPAFGQLMGASPDSIIGKTDYDFFPAEIAAQFQADDVAAANSAHPLVREEWVTYLSDMHRGLLETIKTPVRAKNGDLIGVLGIARDITNNHVLLNELEKARAEAQQSNAAKSSFLANMSHEIRTPMNAIIGMADLALNTQLNTRQRNYLEKIKSASDALLRIINDILDFSKIEVGKLQMESIPFVLETVFDQLSGIVALRAEKQGVELAYDIDDDSRLLKGDPLRLGQVLINLVGNALKFSAGGSVVVRVKTVSATDSLTELQFSVSDEGIGISPEQLANLFQPFTQADASTTRRYGGTGLGLAISKHLVSMMNGELWAESTPGLGSTFFFTARFETAGPDRRTGIVEFAKRLTEHAASPVLVIDDSPIAITILKHLIEQLGLMVETASSGEEVLSRYAGDAVPNYLACFVDWRMPTMDGIETIKNLRNLLKDRDIEKVPPMILVTAYSHHEELRDVGHVIDGLLAKPVSSRHLYVELARCLGSVTGEKPAIDRRKKQDLQWSRFKGLDILLVEDVEVNQEVIMELLGTVGLTARLAENGVLALQAVAEKTPDLILMDCQMPVMDGYTATAKLRANQATQEIPIIALTANAFASDEAKCIAAGMNAHVSKPIRMEMLYEQMVKCLHDRPPKPEIPTRDSVDHPTVDIPKLPGIDVPLGLAHVGGNPTLLLRVLKQFRDNQGKHFAARFQTAQDEGDWETRHRLAHSIKGVAHTLGASDLADKAVELLRATEAKDDAEVLRLFPEVVQQLNHVAAGLVALETLIDTATSTIGQK